MKFSKNDPMYYKCEIEKLIEEAKEEGLKIKVSFNDQGAKILFLAPNGDLIGAKVINS